MDLILREKSRYLPFLKIVSVFILFSGVMALGYTYVLYPTLVPSYGAGEPFNLTNSNNYTFQLPLYSNSRIHLTIEANNSVLVFIDGIFVHNGSNYVTSIEPQSRIVIKVQATSAVSGKFLAHQEPIWFMELISIGTFLFGLVSVISVLALDKFLDRT